MNRRTLSCVVALMAVALLAADSPPKPTLLTQEGKLVFIVESKQGREGRIVMSDVSGRNRHMYGVPAKARITLNGNSATLADLKKGDRVGVAIDRDNKVTEIIALRDGHRIVVSASEFGYRSSKDPC